MDRLSGMIGRENDLDDVARALYEFARKQGMPVVGAMHLTCADESELECIKSFQQGFVQYLLPKMKFAHESAFRLANLGGRYEWGAIQIAEDHFSTPKANESYKLLVVKVNSHVAVEWRDAAETFGTLIRYDCESTCCGALAALLSGAHAPFLDDLRDVFSSEGKDRVPMASNFRMSSLVGSPGAVSGQILLILSFFTYSMPVPNGEQSHLCRLVPK